MILHSHPVHDMDKHFIIDPITRSVTNAESKKTLLMQNDHNSERFSFEIDKMIEGHDLTLCNKVEVHYSNVDANKKNKSSGVYEVDDLQVSADDPNKLVFTWLVSQNATIHAGSLSFLILFACVEKGETTYRWNTGINTSISISKGMNNGEAIEEAYPDILTQWKADLFASIYGMETTHVGPTEPETYPYIWFDTSNYYGDTEHTIGVLTVKDAEGNKTVLYPYALLAGTDGASLQDQFKEQAETIVEMKKTDETLAESISNLSTSMTEADEALAKSISDLSTSTTEADKALDKSISDLGTELRGTDVLLTKNIASKPQIYTQVVSLVAANWVLNAETELYEQTVSVTGITADKTKTSVYVSPPINRELEEIYTDAVVRASEQGENTVTFTSVDLPEVDLNVPVMVVILGVIS